MANQDHFCYRHSLDCTRCIFDLIRIFRGDQQAAEEERFIVFVKAQGRELARYAATNGLSEALEIMECLKEVYPLVFILRGYQAYALARDGEVKAI